MTDGMGLRVLVLEDQLSDQTLITESLKGSGVQIAGTFGHLEALLVALRGTAPTDLVIADLNVADSTGATTLSLILAAHPDIPVVVCTGDDSAAEQVRTIGTVEVIAKSRILEDLCAVVLRARRRSVGATGAYQRAFDLADVALIVVSDYDEVLLTNTAVQDLLGRTFEIGSRLTMLFTPADRLEVATFLADLYEAAGKRVWTTARLRVGPRTSDELLQVCTISGALDVEARLAHISLTVAS